jgi:hypothetical protein
MIADAIMTTSTPAMISRIFRLPLIVQTSLLPALSDDIIIGKSSVFFKDYLEIEQDGEDSW